MRMNFAAITALFLLAGWLPCLTSLASPRQTRRTSRIYMSAPHSHQQFFYTNIKRALNSFILIPSVTYSLTSQYSNAMSDNPSVEITDYAYFDLKIANYTEESIGTNRGARGSGRIKIALFGKEAPKSVSRFLMTLDGDGNQSPNYLNSQFTRIVNDTLLEIERVRGMNTIDIAGTESLEFKGNVLTEFTPILESNNLRHTK